MTFKTDEQIIRTLNCFIEATRLKVKLETDFFLSIKERERILAELEEREREIQAARETLKEWRTLRTTGEL